MSTPEEKLAAIAAILGDTAPAASPVQWWHFTGAPPTVALADPANVDEVKRYAAHGFKFNLKRGVDPIDFPHRVAICDQLGDPNLTAAGAANVISGAEDFPTDVAIYLILTGCTQGFSPTLTPTIFAPKWIQNITDAAYYAAAVRNPNDPGPSGQNG